MAGKTILYEWLEKWEQALESPEPADLDAFVQNNCREGDPSLVAEFRRRAEALHSLQPDLHAFGPVTRGRSDAPKNAHSPSGPSPVLQPGQEVVPKYPLVRFLGRGGFGEVWEACDPSGGRVAMKFVPLGSHASVEERALAIMSRVKHPHLISVLEWWRTADFLVIAMELADSTLERRLDQVRVEGQRGISQEEALRYFDQAADALDYLNHSPFEEPGQPFRGIQHRDIKPQNLLLIGGVLKIGDFGLARGLEHSLTSHTGIHTHAYAAPEFLEGKASSQSDQYSLAVTWYVLRTGQLPSRSSPDLSVLPLCERQPVRRALSKQPKKRWPSCRDFVAALRDRATSARRAGRRSRKEPAGFVRVVDLGHKDCIMALALSASSPLIASASRDCSVRLGNTDTGQLVATQPRAEHRWSVVLVALSPDGSVVASVSEGGRRANSDMMEPSLWRPQQRTRTQPGRAERYRYPFLSPVFSPVGQVIAFGCDRIRLFDINSGEQCGHFPVENRPYPRRLCFSPDGKCLVSGYDEGRIDIWDLTGHHLRGLSGHRSCVTALAISPDGKQLASADKSGALLVRHFPTGRNRRTLKKGSEGVTREAERVTCLAFFPDSLHLLSFHQQDSGGLVRLWHTSNGQRVEGWRPEEGWLSCVALAQNGELLATGEANGKVRLWRTAVIFQAPELIQPGTPES